jgi:hypothetical protein
LRILEYLSSKFKYTVYVWSEPCKNKCRKTVTDIVHVQSS